MTQDKPRWSGDAQFEIVEIAKVTAETNGWSIKRTDSRSFWMPHKEGLEPKVGDRVTIFGKGIGYPFRGLLLNGVEVFYRTEAKDKEYREGERYGATAQELLDRWDAGKTVWSMEMGGMSPGYEQALQLAGFEALRLFLAIGTDPDEWDANNVTWKRDLSRIETAMVPVSSHLGLSGAQYAAAINMASVFYRHGPVKAMNMPELDDRKIMVNRKLPTLDFKAELQ